MNDDKTPQSAATTPESLQGNSTDRAAESYTAEERNSIALNVFFNISEGWSLTEGEKVILLGNPDPATYLAWQRGDNLELPAEVIERISYVIGIYKALRTLYPTRERADAWVKKTNRAYDGKTALQVMLDGNLAQVRKHLDAECV